MRMAPSRDLIPIGSIPIYIVSRQQWKTLSAQKQKIKNKTHNPIIFIPIYPDIYLPSNCSDGQSRFTPWLLNRELTGIAVLIKQVHLGIQRVEKGNQQWYALFPSLQYMRSLSPRAKKHSAPLVIYDAEEDLSSRCCVCFTSEPRLMNPCQCSTQYHQTCLLRYIRQKLLSMKKELDFSQLRCKKCKQQIRFLHYENTHYSCNYFCNKIRRNWCNKSLILIIALTMAIIALGIVLGRHTKNEGMLYYGMLIGESVLVLILIVTIVVFVQSNLVYKEIILVRVYEFVEIRNNTSSSDSSPRHNIASETFEIIIDEEY